MHYNEHKPANQFLDSLASNSYLLYTIQPSWHTSHSRTLIDNFFSNVITKDIICGNITAPISDHWPQFLVSPNTIANPPSNKSNAFERDWSKFDQENFILVYFHIDSVFSNSCQHSPNANVIANMKSKITVSCRHFFADMIFWATWKRKV